MQVALHTTRLSLSPLILEDDEFILKLLNSDGWLKYIGDRKVRSKEESRDYIKAILNNPEITYWVVKLKDGHISIGIITYIKRDYLPDYDLGFAFLNAYTGAGYAYEAARAIMNTVNGKTLYAVVLPQNIPSVRLLKKLSFVFKRKIRLHGEITHIYQSKHEPGIV